VGGVGPAGGSITLTRILDNHGEAVLADLQAYYGINLVREMGGGMSPTQIIVLIRQLPLESRTIASFRGGEEFIGWGVDRYMMAQLMDSIQNTTYAVVAANSKRKPKAPKPVYRPKKGGRAAGNLFAQQIARVKKAKGG
jgi:hypothetical protein